MGDPRPRRRATDGSGGSVGTPEPPSRAEPRGEDGRRGAADPAPVVRDPGGWHVLVVVENVAVGVDTRLRKQVDDLLEAGYRISVVTDAHPRERAVPLRPAHAAPGIPRPARAASASPATRVEYAVSFLAAVAGCLRACCGRDVDVLQLCQPPDIYFPLARRAARVGMPGRASTSGT